MHTCRISFLLPVVFLGCSEYGMTGKLEPEGGALQSNDTTNEEEPPEEEEIPQEEPLIPDIVVDPPLIDYGIVYEGMSSEDAFQIQNVEAGPLTVTQVEITTGYDLGYSLTLPEPLPWRLETGEYREVLVTYESQSGQAAYGGVSITSDDPDEPLSTVTLVVQPYQLPQETMEGCEGVANITLDQEVSVWSWDSGPDVGTVEVDIAGTYHVYSNYIAESGASQMNESAYIRIGNASNPDGYPLLNNCNDDWVVPDLDNAGSVPANMVAYVGTFILDAGINTISMYHYCPLYRAGECPSFHIPDDSDSTCDSGNVNSVHFTGTAVCLLPAL